MMTMMMMLNTQLAYDVYMVSRPEKSPITVLSSFSSSIQLFFFLFFFFDFDLNKSHFGLFEHD